MGKTSELRKTIQINGLCQTGVKVLVLKTQNVLVFLLRALQYALLSISGRAACWLFRR